MCDNSAHHVKGVVDLETRNFLIRAFYRKGLECILIGDNPLG